MKIFKFSLWGLLLLVFAMACQKKEPARQAGKTDNPEIDALSEMINEDPGNDSLYFKRALVYDKLHNYDEAIRDISQAMAIDSTVIDYYYYKSDLYMRYAKSRLALQTMEQVVSMVPNQVKPLLELAEVQCKLKMYNESLTTIGKVIALEPQNPEAFFLTGVNLREKGEKDRAINAFQECFELDPSHLDACLNLGLLWEEKNSPVALKYYDNALRIDSTNVLAYYNKGMYYLNRHEDEKAIEQFRKLLAINPHYKDAYFNIGIIQLERDSLKKAYDNFNIAVTEDPLFDMGWYYRGKTNEAMNNLEAARADYKQALGLSPSYPKFKEAVEKIERKMQ